jgi:DNA-binding transcriptional ArsR family regulator
MDYGILNEIKITARSSGDLAETLDVSDRTVRERYRKLRKHELVKTSRKHGVELTARGVQFLRLILKKGCEVVKKDFTIEGYESPVVKQNFTTEQGNAGESQKSDPDDDPVVKQNFTTSQANEKETEKSDFSLGDTIRFLLETIRRMTSDKDNGGYATIEALREISRTCGIEDERLETYLRRMLERGLIMEIEEGKYKPTGG